MKEDLFYCKAVGGLPVWEAQQKMFKFFLQPEIDGHKLYAQFGLETGQRTLPQNNSLHLFCEQLSQELNNAGLSVQEVLAQAMEFDWTMYRVKENLWKPALFRLTGKDSTKKMDKVSDISLVHTHLIRHIGEKFGVIVPAWPSEQSR